MSTLKYILLIILLLCGLVGSVFLALRVTVFQNRATSNSSVGSFENSYLFASPLQAKSSTNEKIRITVFLLNDRGLGIPNRPVEVITNSSTTKTALQPITDDTGKALFDITSNIPQTVDVSAQSDGKTLPQKIKVTFY